MKVRADFHNHSCLSPCAGLEMGPAALVSLAAAQGIGLLALTDHNSARNTPAFEVLARKAGLLPLCGIEVTTSEEIHVLCLFPRSNPAVEFGLFIESTLPRVPLNPDKMGWEVVVNHKEEVLEELEFYLGVASSLGIAEVEAACHLAGGLFIPAHIDRPSNSLSSQLGYVPPLNYDGFEVHLGPGTLQTGRTPLVRGSDAHHPEMVGNRTCEIEVEELSWEGVKRFFSLGVQSKP